MVSFTLKCSTWSPILKLNPRIPILVCTHISVFAMLFNAQLAPFVAAFTRGRSHGHRVTVTFVHGEDLAD